MALNATKALEAYWNDFHSNGRIAPNSPSFDVLRGSRMLGPIEDIFPSPQEARELVWSGQTANVLRMFTIGATMTMPYFEAVFNGELSTMYWKLLTRPVHVDMTIGFDDPSWQLEQRAARSQRMKKNHDEAIRGEGGKLRRRSKSNKFKESIESNYMEEDVPERRDEDRHGSFSILRSKTMPNPPPLPPNFHSPTTSLFVDVTRQTENSPLNPSNEKPLEEMDEDEQNSSLSGEYSSRYHASLFEPSFQADENGLYCAPTGTRRFDAMTDFLHIKSPRVEDIISLLEYGVALLRGSSFLGWTEVNTLIGFNVERILHSLMNRFHQDLDIRIVDRIMTCLTIYALQFENSGRFELIAPYLLFGYRLACKHGLDRIDPQGVCRMILTVLFYTPEPELREQYEQEALTRFADLTGIVLRTRFSYVSGALLTPKTHKLYNSVEYWKKVENYLIEAEYILPHLETASDLPTSSTVLFKCLFAGMRAELGPRVGHPEWVVQQATLITKHLCSLEDQNTFIAIGIFVRFRIHSKKSSVEFDLHKRKITVADYLTEQISAIPTMPTHPIIPGEEPFLADTSILFEGIPVVPDSSNHFASHSSAHGRSKAHASKGMNAKLNAINRSGSSAPSPPHHAPPSLSSSSSSTISSRTPSGSHSRNISSSGGYSSSSNSVGGSSTNSPHSFTSTLAGSQSSNANFSASSSYGSSSGLARNASSPSEPSIVSGGSVSPVVLSPISPNAFLQDSSVLSSDLDTLSSGSASSPRRAIISSLGSGYKRSSPNTYGSYNFERGLTNPFGSSMDASDSNSMLGENMAQYGLVEDPLMDPTSPSTTADSQFMQTVDQEEDVQEENSTSETNGGPRSTASSGAEQPGSRSQTPGSANTEQNSGASSSTNSAGSSIPIADNKSPFQKDNGPEAPAPARDSTYSKSVIGY